MQITIQRTTVQEHTFEVDITQEEFDDDTHFEKANDAAVDYDWNLASSGGAEYEIVDIKLGDIQFLK
jgi:hypothetical protein